MDSLSLLTSVLPGNICSLAFNLAPLASWISLILLPPFPILRKRHRVNLIILILQAEAVITHTLPILLLGIMNLMVTGRLPGREG